MSEDRTEMRMVSRRSTGRWWSAALVALASVLLASPAHAADPVPFATMAGTCIGEATVDGAPVASPHSFFLARYTVASGTVLLGNSYVSAGEVVWSLHTETLNSNESPREEAFCSGAQPMPFTATYVDAPTTPTTFAGVGSASGSVIAFIVPYAGQYVADLTLSGGGVTISDVSSLDASSYEENTGPVRFAASGQYSLGTARAGTHVLSVEALVGPTPAWSLTMRALPVAVTSLSFGRTSTRPGEDIQAAYTTTGDTTISAEVRNANGRSVATLASDLPVKAGDHMLAWDGTSDAGLPLADGKYTLVVESLDASGQTSSAKASIRVAALPPQEQASARGVMARFYYTKPTGDSNEFTNLRVQILRGGAVLVNQAIPPWHGRADYGVQPAGFGSSRSLTVRDFDGDGVPEVSLLLYWGGAHCCFWSRVYRYDSSAKRYRVSHHFWSDFEPRLRDLDRDGKPEFTSADARFENLPSCFGCIAYPIQIWSYRRGVFADVTRRFPHAIRADANQAIRPFTNGKYDDLRGYAAGWAADQALLGHASQARQQLERWTQQGLLGTAFSGPTDRQFVSFVWKFLARSGYLR